MSAVCRSRGRVELGCSIVVMLLLVSLGGCGPARRRDGLGGGAGGAGTGGTGGVAGVGGSDAALVDAALPDTGDAPIDAMADAPGDASADAVVDAMADAGAVDTPPDTHCGPRESFGGHDYWACDDLRSWEQARVRCLAIGAHLVWIESAEEDAAVRAFADAADATGPVWIGASDALVEGEWRWGNDVLFWIGNGGGGAVPGNYAHWAGGAPGGGDGEYVAVLRSDDQWDDWPANARENFVCERE